MFNKFLDISAGLSWSKLVYAGLCWSGAGFAAYPSTAMLVDQHTSIKTQHIPVLLVTSNTLLVYLAVLPEVGTFLLFSC